MVSPGYLAFHADPKKPDQPLPANACDAHCHVFGPQAVYPFAPSSTYEPVDAGKEILFQRHQFLGVDRAVVVQASCHGTDNSAMLDALKSGGDRYKGIAIVADDVDHKSLDEMNEAGVRGVRFNFVKRLGGGKPPEYYRTILEKIRRYDWHVVVYFDSEDIVSLAPFLQEIPCQVVIDHMGRVPVEQGTGGHAYRLLHNLLVNDDRFWVKISCAERLSASGPPYADVDPIAVDLLATVPERILWGTDWPHPNMKSHMPDDGQLVDRIMTICANTALQQKVLVENPARLYGF